MVTTLTATPVEERPGREWGARGASVALHGGLIALAVWLTQRPLAPPPVREVLLEPLVWNLRPHTPPPAPPPSGVPGAPGPLVVPTVIAVTVPAVDVPPLPDWAAPPPGPVTGTPGVGVPGPTGPPSPPVAPVDVQVVEEPPVLLAHPAPRYPDVLRQAGVEGRALVEAVIDTAGRAERGSIRVVSSTHALFASAASALVRGSRYQPGRVAGRTVRVRIVVPVTFTLRR